MKLIRSLAILMVAGVCFASAQAPEQKPVAKTSTQSEVPSKGSNSDNGSSSGAVQDEKYVRPDSKTRFNRYVKSTFGPMALGKKVLTSGYSTWRNSPEEWGDKWEGFGKRFASSLGKSVIKNTTIYTLDETLKVDSRYYRSRKKDFGSKLGNALISPVTARNAEGKRVIGIPRIVGTYTASIAAAELWYPSRFDYKDGLKSATVSLGFNAAFNIIKEFVWKK